MVGAIPFHWTDVVVSMFGKQVYTSTYKSGIVTYDLGKYRLVEQEEMSSVLAVPHSHLSG